MRYIRKERKETRKEKSVNFQYNFRIFIVFFFFSPDEIKFRNVLEINGYGFKNILWQKTELKV